MMRTRHTMGQDVAGSRRLNPEGVPKITRQQVLDRAAELNIRVKRDGDCGVRGMWWFLDSKCTWRSLGMTNYLALQCLERVSEWNAKH
jgi:hypothetical protein